MVSSTLWSVPTPACMRPCWATSCPTFGPQLACSEGCRSGPCGWQPGSRICLKRCEALGQVATRPASGLQLGLLRQLGLVRDGQGRLHGAGLQLRQRSMWRPSDHSAGADASRWRGSGSVPGSCGPTATALCGPRRAPAQRSGAVRR